MQDRVILIGVLYWAKLLPNIFERRTYSFYENLATKDAAT
jgi:hypothetical protein